MYGPSSHDTRTVVNSDYQTEEATGRITFVLGKTIKLDKNTKGMIRISCT